MDHQQNHYVPALWTTQPPHQHEPVISPYTWSILLAILGYAVAIWGHNAVSSITFYQRRISLIKNFFITELVAVLGLSLGSVTSLVVKPAHVLLAIDSARMFLVVINSVMNYLAMMLLACFIGSAACNLCLAFDAERKQISEVNARERPRAQRPLEKKGFNQQQSPHQSQDQVEFNQRYEAWRKQCRILLANPNWSGKGVGLPLAPLPHGCRSCVQHLTVCKRCIVDFYGSANLSATEILRDHEIWLVLQRRIEARFVLHEYIRARAADFGS
ncbi:hypothetical protein KCU71_g2458, partial [Aureobasidium melanogenum]